jgi:hypothetical protein
MFFIAPIDPWGCLRHEHGASAMCASAKPVCHKVVGNLFPKKRGFCPPERSEGTHSARLDAEMLHSTPLHSA